MIQNQQQIGTVVSYAEIGRVQDWVGEVLRNYSPEDIKRLLSKEDLLQTCLLIFFHDFLKGRSRVVYQVRVNGIEKKLEFVSQPTGWIYAWDFMNRMIVTGRKTSLADLSAFAVSHQHESYHVPILAGGEISSDRKDHYSFYHLNRGQIDMRYFKSMPNNYRYLALSQG